MGWFSKLIGGGVKEAGEGINAALGGAGNFLNDIRTALTGIDAKKQAEIMGKVQNAIAAINAAQTEVNKIEAASGSLFISGWRPGLAWVCVISVALYYIPRFLLGMFFWARQVIIEKELIALPAMGIGDILGLVGILLGASGIRAWEKKQGVARN